MYLKSPTIENLNGLRKAKNRPTKSIRNSKRDFYDKYANFKGKAKSLFDAYNHFCKDEKKNEIELDVEQFNAFFATIGSKLAESYNINNFICKTKLVEHTIFLPKLTTDEVVCVIENFKNSSSFGHDGISNIIWKFQLQTLPRFWMKFSTIAWTRVSFLIISKRHAFYLCTKTAVVKIPVTTDL